MKLISEKFSLEGFELDDDGNSVPVVVFDNEELNEKYRLSKGIEEILFGFIPGDVFLAVTVNDDVVYSISFLENEKQKRLDKIKELKKSIRGGIK